MTNASMTITDGALRLWAEIARGLEAAGYSKVVPEYLKLSRALSQVRRTELLQCVPEAEHWKKIRNLAGEALLSLGPLVEAARILAELPSELQGLDAGELLISPELSAIRPPDSIIEPEAPSSSAEATPDITPSKPARKRRKVSPALQAKKSSTSQPRAHRAIKVRKPAVSKSKRPATRGAR